jgi:hypothetical protein
VSPGKIRSADESRAFKVEVRIGRWCEWVPVVDDDFLLFGRLECIVVAHRLYTSFLYGKAMTNDEVQVILEACRLPEGQNVAGVIARATEEDRFSGKSRQFPGDISAERINNFCLTGPGHATEPGV